MVIKLQNFKTMKLFDAFTGKFIPIKEKPVAPLTVDFDSTRLMKFPDSDYPKLEKLIQEIQSFVGKNPDDIFAKDYLARLKNALESMNKPKQ